MAWQAVPNYGLTDYGLAEFAIPGDPVSPSGFTAVAVSSTVIDLDWSDVSLEDNYELERSLNGVDGWTLIYEPAADEVSYSDTGLSAETAYYYRLRSAGVGGYSEWVLANATTDVSPANTTETTITIGAGL